MSADVTKDLLEFVKAWLECQGGDNNYMTAKARAAIARAEAALAEPQPDADGWTPWAGGKCPVGAKTGVQVKDRTGRTCLGAGWEFDWEHAASDYDILAYRVVKR